MVLSGDQAMTITCINPPELVGMQLRSPVVVAMSAKAHLVFKCWSSVVVK